MSRTITYNGYTFPFSVLAVRETPRYDNDDRTLLGTMYTFTVRGIVWGSGTSDFWTQLRNMRQRLGVPRQTFKVTSNGTIDFFEFNASTDETWGPKPGELTLEQFANMNAARYSWSCQVFRRVCDDVGGPSGNKSIISITKKYQFTVDAAGLNTRTVSGKIVVADNAAPADQYRDQINVPLPTNYRRTSSQYSQSADQRVMTFTITDEEVIHTLPTDVAEGQVSWSVRLVDLGARIMYNLSGSLSGPRSTSKPDLFARLVEIIQAKFPLEDEGLVFEDFQMSEDVYGNSISFQITASGVTGREPASGEPDYRSVFRRMSVTPQHSDGQEYLPPWYGGTPGPGTAANLVGIWDGCNNTGSEDEQPASAITPTRSGGPTQPASNVDVVDNSGISFEHQQTPYVVYHERISYELDNHLVFFDGKDNSTEPVVQKTAPTSLMAIQAGYMVIYARRVEDVPKPPLPVFGDSGRVLQASVQPIVPNPVTEGSVNQYTTHWRYVCRLTTNVKDENPVEANMRFPLDPRRATPEDANPWQGEVIGIGNY